MNWDWKKWLNDLNFTEIFSGLINVAKNWVLEETLLGKLFGFAQKAPSTILTGESAKQAADFISQMNGAADKFAQSAAEQAAAIAKAEAAKLNPTRLTGGVPAAAPSTPNVPAGPAAPATAERSAL